MAPEHEEPRIAWYSRFARHPYYGRTGINSGVMLMNMTRMRKTFFKVCLHINVILLWGCIVFFWPQGVLLQPYFILLNATVLKVSFSKNLLIIDFCPTLWWQNDMTSVGLRWEELLMPLLQKYKLNITWGDQDLLNIIFHYNPGEKWLYILHTNKKGQILQSRVTFSVQWHFYPCRFFQSFCWSFLATGITVLITASTAVTVPLLKKKASTYCMETEGFSTMANNLLSEQFTRPFERWACGLCKSDCVTDACVGDETRECCGCSLVKRLIGRDLL